MQVYFDIIYLLKPLFYRPLFKLNYQISTLIQKNKVYGFITDVLFKWFTIFLQQILISRDEQLKKQPQQIVENSFARLCCFKIF